MKPRTTTIELVICYLLFVIAMVIMLSCSSTTSVKRSNTSCYFSNHREVENTIEDMKEWMIWDIQEGRIDSTIGATYVYNLDNLSNLMD